MADISQQVDIVIDIDYTITETGVVLSQDTKDKLRRLYVRGNANNTIIRFVGSNPQGDLIKSTQRPTLWDKNMTDNILFVACFLNGELVEFDCGEITPDDYKD